MQNFGWLLFEHKNRSTSEGHRHAMALLDADIPITGKGAQPKSRYEHLPPPRANRDLRTGVIAG